MKPNRRRDAERKAAACDGKKTYTDILHARRVARALREHHAEHVAPYRCVRCNGFHLGSSDHRSKPLKDR